jgi:hypothetical protein
MSLLSGEDLESLLAYVTHRYETSGQPPDVVRALNEHNHRVLGHVDEIAQGEGLAAEDHQLLRTIAILHDVAKADTHLMLHAEIGGEVAREKLEELGKDEDFIATVQQAIKCHLGPFPFIEEEAEKYAERTGEHLHLPRPQTRIEQLFYDADMLALMDVEGIEKVRVLRETTAEFMAEDEDEAQRQGGTPRAAAYRSALQSVRRAADTLHCATAKHIGERLIEQANRHVESRISAERTTA